jgi:putative aldouronate transport system substrate-binding protein
MKKILSILLVLTLAASLFAAGEGESTDDGAVMGALVNPAGEFPIVDEMITLTVAVQNDPKIEDLNTNELTLEYEAKTNIKVDWVLLPWGGDALEQKINLMLATGSDLPDVFLNSGINNSKQLIYGVQQHIFQPLDDLINKYAPNLLTMINYREDIRDMITAPDGQIYAIPAIAEAYHTQVPQKMWMNGAFLDTLDLEVPTTTDELYTVLKAFKEQDPNGNGLQDEVPLTGGITGWGTKVVDFVMSAFIPSINEPNKRRWLVNDGVVSVPFNQPEWRDGLKYLNMLYEEGLLDPAAFTQSVQQLRKLTENPDAWIVGASTAGAPGGMSNSNSARSNQYVAVPPLTGPEGVKVAAYKPFGYNIGKFVITNACENPEAAIRWIDWFASAEGSLRARNGVKDRDWRWAEDGELGVNGEQGVYLRVLKFGKVQNTHWNKNTPDFYPDKLRNGMVSDAKDVENYLYDVTKESYIDFIPEEVWMPFFMTEAEAEEFAELDYLVPTFVTESYTRFITGDLDVDNDAQWNNYLEELDNIGLDRYVEITQSGYTRQYN